MYVLVLGYRQGLAKALKDMKIDFIVWSSKKVMYSNGSFEVIHKDYPNSKEEFLKTTPNLSSISHVIACVESSVIAASNIRFWLDLNRNPHSVILRCTDKLQMKKFLSQKNIPMTTFCDASVDESSKIVSTLGFPLLAKPKLSSGGRGIEKIDSETKVQSFKAEDYYFERIIDGSEGSVESLIVDSEIIYSNITEYYKNGICNKVPAQYDMSTKKRILDLNKKVIDALGVKWGMTHVEFYICERGILFGEVALRPPGGYILNLLSLIHDQNFWKLFVQVELQMTNIKIKKASRFAASIILYPEEGVINKVSGTDDLDVTSLVHLSVKLKKGMVVGKRDGVGQDYGYALLISDSKELLNKDVEKFNKSFKVEYEN